jgi:hypothetical protein
MLFDEYLFADYSGAFDARGQRKSIQLAAASVDGVPSIVERGLTRDDLVEEFVDRLESATNRGLRICFGQDHQYGAPWGLVHDLGLSDRPWRAVVEALATGAYGGSAPEFGHPRAFARRFNEWLVARGRHPYFYSATKSQLYGVPQRNPRPGDRACYRLTELCRSHSGTGAPKPFNRVGDNGTVGGQSLVGILAIRNLLAQSARRNIPVAVWPFDGLSIGDQAYKGAHVMIEPYPSAVRAADVMQTDESDALACAAHLRTTDRTGSLYSLLDLSAIRPEDAPIVAIEGWIISHRPDSRK